uniref:Uncharacterized protein n=1 Tax=Aegilops tauschii subsp. strangulata TaxID=200361 RepID=A0A453C119_AEGTS
PAAPPPLSSPSRSSPLPPHGLRRNPQRRHRGTQPR